MKTSLRFLRLAALVGFLSCCAGYVVADDYPPNSNPECYRLMILQCNQEASNSPEGGYDQAYDACIANWYANAKCGSSTPFPTAAPGEVIGRPKQPRPVRKVQHR